MKKRRCGSPVMGLGQAQSGFDWMGTMGFILLELRSKMGSFGFREEVGFVVNERLTGFDEQIRMLSERDVGSTVPMRHRGRESRLFLDDGHGVPSDL